MLPGEPVSTMPDFADVGSVTKKVGERPVGKRPCAACPALDEARFCVDLAAPEILFKQGDRSELQIPVEYESNSFRLSGIDDELLAFLRREIDRPRQSRGSPYPSIAGSAPRRI